MNPRLFSNRAINGIRGLYGDVGRTIREDVPLSYAIRNREARQAFDDWVAQGRRGDFRFGEGTIDYRRAAALAASSYAAADLGYRALSGGSIYRNHTGERDLVGIPFI